MSYENVASGEYVTNDIIRWHNGAIVTIDFVDYFSKRHPCKNDAAFANFLVKERGFDKGYAVKFVKILHRLQQDDSIPLSPSAADGLRTRDPKYVAGSMALYKLVCAWQQSLLSNEEQQVVSKIAKICMDPRLVPAAMDTYAEKTISALSACDKNDPEQIANFLAESFYELTEIHPFGNGNGRVATCIMNIFLRYFNYPSILLRRPGEKEDTNSDYSKAIDATKVTVSRIKGNSAISVVKCDAVNFQKIIKAAAQKESVPELETSISSLSFA